MVGLPSPLPRREVLADPGAGTGPEAVEAGICLRPGTAGHSSVCRLSAHLFCIQGAFRTLMAPLWPQFSYL